MTAPGPGGRFERHPRLTAGLLLVGGLILSELALRLLAPAPLRFAHEMRRVHAYSRTSRVDLRPSQSARLRIDRADGRPLFDFRLATGPLGFRVGEGQAELEPAAASGAGAVRYLHAIGDSYTMGWGVDASDSYPFRLALRLEPGRRVLNLGVDGFGAIGATAKSRALAARYPPAHAVYLFSPNDLEDDERAAAVARRSRPEHVAHEALDAVRRQSYLAAVPFAIRYRLQFREGVGASGEASLTGTGGQAGTARLEPTKLLLPEPAALDALPGGARTFTAMAEYRDFLAARGATLHVLVLSTQPESLRMLRFCRESRIAARLFDVPPALRIPGEGHFNAAGNDAVAALVAELLRE